MNKQIFWKKIWFILDRTSQIVTIAGIIGVFGFFIDYNRESKKEQKLSIQEQADNLINQAVGIFITAKDTIDYQNAYEKFLKGNKLKPNDMTGYRLFFELAERILEDIKNDNRGIYKYDENVEKYFQWAKSLNIYRNEAENRLNDLQELKKQGLINDKK